MSLAQKIADIEAEMARTQRNKATEHHMGLLKAKLSKLKSQLIDSSSGKGGATGEGFEVSKSGDARVGMVGFPSVGKSTLLTKLTGTFSKVAAYEFTTLTCIPGVIKYKGSKIQLLDLPGIIEGAKDGKGRGKQVIAVARTCNLIVIVLDAMKPLTHKRIIERELEGFGIRLNKKPPAITIKRKPKGGVTISRTMQGGKLDDDYVSAILKEYKISNADVLIDCDPTEDELIDVIEGNRKYIPCLYAMNKIDEITMEELDILDKVPHYVPCSAHKEWNLDELVEKMWEYLDLLRIYTKPKGQIPDYNAPVVLPRTTNTMEDFCNRIHRSMLANFKTAIVWGSSVKFNPQKVGKDHKLADEDVVQIVKKSG
jgi:small GTP-binding protein